MIRNLTDRLNCWYNSRAKRQKATLLCGFCLVFLLLLGLSIRYGHYDASHFTNKTPANIGKPSGPEFRDSLKHQKQ